MSVSLKSSILLLFVGILFPVLANAATLRIVPSTATVEAGETISVAVSITSSDQAMNATEGVLKFPPDLLQVAAISKGGSVLGLWVQEPSFSNAAGTVNFEGVALNPGYVGSNGTVLTVTFRARTEGSAALSIIGASVLANDGNGTEILTGTSGGTVSITSATERPQPVSQPNQTKPQSVPAEKPTAAEHQPEAPREIKATIEKQFDFTRLFAWLQRMSPLLLLLLVLVFLVLDVLLFLQYLRLRKREGGELEHAQNLTHRSFLALRDDVDSFVDELEKASEKRKLTPIEARFVKEMRSDLSAAEKTIVKELREAEKDIK